MLKDVGEPEVDPNGEWLINKTQEMITRAMYIARRQVNQHIARLEERSRINRQKICFLSSRWSHIGNLE